MEVAVATFSFGNLSATSDRHCGPVNAMARPYALGSQMGGEGGCKGKAGEGGRGRRGAARRFSGIRLDGDSHSLRRRRLKSCSAAEACACGAMLHGVSDTARKRHVHGCWKCKSRETQARARCAYTQDAPARGDKRRGPQSPYTNKPSECMLLSAAARIKVRREGPRPALLDRPAQ